MVIYIEAPPKQPSRAGFQAFYFSVSIARIVFNNTLAPLVISVDVENSLDE